MWCTLPPCMWQVWRPPSAHTSHNYGGHTDPEHVRKKVTCDVRKLVFSLVQYVLLKYFIFINDNNIQYSCMMCNVLIQFHIVMVFNLRKVGIRKHVLA